MPVVSSSEVSCEGSDILTFTVFNACQQTTYWNIWVDVAKNFLE